MEEIEINGPNYTGFFKTRNFLLTAIMAVIIVVIVDGLISHSSTHGLIVHVKGIEGRFMP